MRPLLPGQCLLLFDAHLLSISSNMWLDGLYLRHMKPRDSLVEDPVETLVVWSASLWMTGVTIQGVGQATEYLNRAVGLATGAKMYAEGAKQIVLLKLVQSITLCPGCSFSFSC
jgi:hypothetical protein